MTMLRLLRIILLAAMTLAGKSQELEHYDTLFTRSNKMVLIARYDSIKQLQEINAKADTILNDLEIIKCKLGLIADTLKPKRDDGD